VASYTANLAAFITISATPALTATSVDQMQVDGLNLCVMAGGWESRFSASYPRMSYLEIEGQVTGGEKLYDGQDCDAVIAPRNDYDSWRTDPKYCTFEVAETLWSEMGGWMTNMESNCVQYALEWALYGLQANGTTDNLYRKYMPIAPCAKESAVATDSFESTNTEARRLSNDKFHVGIPPSSRPMASGSTDRHRKRRLKSEAAQGGGSGATTRMSAFDFVGIFLMWGIATGMVLLYLFGVKLYQIPTVAERIVRFRIKHLGYVVPEETPSDECGRNKNISINNENAMLREVLRQLGLLQHDIRQTQKLAVLTEEDRKGVKASGERAKANWTGDGSRAAIISSVAALNESSVSAKETHSHHTTASSMVAAALHIGHRTHTVHVETPAPPSTSI